MVFCIACSCLSTLAVCPCSSFGVDFVSLDLPSTPGRIPDAIYVTPGGSDSFEPIVVGMVDGVRCESGGWVFAYLLSPPDFRGRLASFYPSQLDVLAEVMSSDADILTPGHVHEDIIPWISPSTISRPPDRIEIIFPPTATTRRVTPSLVMSRPRPRSQMSTSSTSTLSESDDLDAAVAHSDTVRNGDFVALQGSLSRRDYRSGSVGSSVRVYSINAVMVEIIV
ncbi:hypothetical protein C8R47DRAFT_1226169 [Mycena vitilis]|nr:hypothetical protein C8R47DRAFT_1226169 [Mycena vitilis]